MTMWWVFFFISGRLSPTIYFQVWVLHSYIFERTRREYKYAFIFWAVNCFFMGVNFDFSLYWIQNQQQQQKQGACFLCGTWRTRLNLYKTIYWNRISLCSHFFNANWAETEGREKKKDLIFITISRDCLKFLLYMDGSSV